MPKAGCASLSRPTGYRLKIARSIADLEGGGAIGPAQVAEAIQYRTMDRKFG
jgi:predicted ATPase with chaperone activity